MSKHLCQGGATSMRDCIQCRAKLIASVNDVKVRRAMIESNAQFDIDELKKNVAEAFKK